MIGFQKINSHIHFVDDKSELKQEEMVHKQEEEKKINVPEVEEIKELTQEKKKAYKRLHEQIGKEKNSNKVLNALNMQKHLMVMICDSIRCRGKGRRRR